MGIEPIINAYKAVVLHIELRAGALVIKLLNIGSSV